MLLLGVAGAAVVRRARAVLAALARRVPLVVETAGGQSVARLEWSTVLLLRMALVAAVVRVVTQVVQPLR